MPARTLLLLIALSPRLALAGEAAPDLAAGIGQMLFGLVVVLAVLVGVLWLLKRLGMSRGGAAGGLKVLGAAAVGARERVVMVQVADRVLVLGVAPGRVNALSEFDVSDLPPGDSTGAEGGTPSGGDFSARLQRLLERRQ
ncbi:flagellar biosynthetic protein FliO [Cognatazoarcus halotolerans]|uniref:flagellar biosynthetic protein FliO n=1 Tax=Cognatazoarcus halotolerans TaxID=2686016 RepID=UPI001F2E36FB|nr:flagellar biosynthetic protein FliO [Cognatazoarcus halotolerans]